MIYVPWSKRFKDAAYYAYMRSVLQYELDTEEKQKLRKLYFIAEKKVQLTTFTILLFFIAALLEVGSLFFYEDRTLMVYAIAMPISCAYVSISFMRELICRIEIAYLMPMYESYKNPEIMRRYILPEVLAADRNELYILIISIVSLLLGGVTLLNLFAPPVAAYAAVCGIMFAGFLWYAYIGIRAYAAVCKSTYDECVKNMLFVTMKRAE